MKICKHFQECGGCRSQDLPYNEQLHSKEARIQDLMSSYQIHSDLKPINYSGEWFYRNKMEFSFADEGELACGLYSKKEKRKVIDLEECLIFSADIPLILKAIKDFLKAKNHSVYNKYSHQGFLRNLIIRQTKFTNQIMIGIVTSNSETFEKEEFVKTLTSLKLQSSIKSIYWIVNDSLSDAVIFEKKVLLYGEPFIEERLGSLTFKIGIDTFFQVNPYMLADFYSKIRDYLNLSNKQSVLDLFCGVGSIGIFLAQDAKFVWGIEISKDIVDMAWQNAKANNIENISFITCDTRKFLNTHGSFYKGIDIVVVNPPRCGLSNKIIRAILRLEPKIIVYSSCNPDALFRDLGGLKEHYSLDFIEPFDFFPHTPHLEVLSLLKKN